MDTALINLYRSRKITSETALHAAHDRDFVKKTLML